MKVAVKKKIRDAFHDEDIQITVSAINLLDDELNRVLSRWVSNTKWCNIKRLTPDLLWTALGRGNLYHNRKKEK
tara:strand:+ start:902 stop:1123 length:222 start_codon:yes stop_codon:yes gene_type:complete